MSNNNGGATITTERVITLTRTAYSRCGPCAGVARKSELILRLMPPLLPEGERTDGPELLKLAQSSCGKEEEGLGLANVEVVSYILACHTQENPLIPLEWEPYCLIYPSGEAESTRLFQIQCHQGEWIEKERRQDVFFWDGNDRFLQTVEIFTTTSRLQTAPG